MPYARSNFPRALVATALLHRLAGTALAGQLAFPTVEGFGANAVGGRGGRVIEVTTLEDSGQAVCEWPWKRPVPASSSFESAGHNAAERHSRQDTVSDGRGLISASFEACEKGGSSRVNRTEPWPDLAAGASAPPTDSDHDGMPDAWKRRTASTLIILVTGPASPPTAIRTWRII